jgi:colanic acid/amylovoran biosynthesis protein
MTAQSIRRITLVNASLLNGGDAAIVMGIMTEVALKYPGAEIVIAERNHAEAQRLHPDLTIISDGMEPRWSGRLARKADLVLQAICLILSVATALLPGLKGWTPIGRFRHLAKQCAASDLVISVGGTYLVETYFILPRLLVIALALASAPAVVLHTQSMGPFRNPLNRWWVKRLLPRCARVSFRDAQSRQHAEALTGAQPGYRVRPDVAFALTPPNRDVAPILERTIAISVRTWRHFPDGDVGTQAYESAMADLVKTLLDNDPNLRVYFVSTCQGTRTYAFDDHACACRIVARLDANRRQRIQLDDRHRTPTEMMALLGRMNAVISTRMHMAIMSLVAGTPAFGIAYEFKTTELYHSLDLDQATMIIEEVRGQSFIPKVMAFLADETRLRCTLQPRVTALKNAAMDVLP